MSTDTLNFATQPAVKLATANMGLMFRFTTSPEVLSQATAATRQLMQQSGALTMNMMQSGAFAQLMQGLLKNYVEFLADTGRTAVEVASSRATRTGKSG